MPPRVDAVLQGLGFDPDETRQRPLEDLSGTFRLADGSGARTSTEDHGARSRDDRGLPRLAGESLPQESSLRLGVSGAQEVRGRRGLK